MRHVQKIRAYLFLIAGLWIGVAHAGGAAAAEPEFAVGQVWSVKSVDNKGVKVVIGRIEPWKDKTAIHVSMIDVPAPEWWPAGGSVTQFPHLPFEQSALANSVETLLATDGKTAPQFETGYAQWKDADGGLFTVSTDEAIHFVFAAVKQTLK